MKMSLQDKTALITGGGKGLGKAISKQLAAHGAIVILHYNKSLNEAAATMSEITAAGGVAYIIQSDFSEPGNIAVFLKNIYTVLDKHGGGLDILVNNAGICERSAPDAFSFAQFQKVMSINLAAQICLIQYLLPKINDNGRIINISSSSPETPELKYLLYAASKAGIDTITKGFVPELGKRGITINAVKPGPLATDVIDGMNHPIVKDFIVSRTAMRRLGTPEDIASVVRFLASPESGWVTGQFIKATGGFGEMGLNNRQ